MKKKLKRESARKPGRKWINGRGKIFGF